MTSINVRELFVKMENSDSDYRFMAASDLLTALTNHSIKVDPDTQKKMARAILKLLKDSNSEVQGMAMRCLPHLAMNVDITNSLYIVGKLLDYVWEGHNSKGRQTMETIGLKAIRDISSIALKSIIAELEPGTEKTIQIGGLLISRLVKNIKDIERNGDPAEVLVDAFEILNECLWRAGTQLSDMHESIAERLFNQSSSKNSLVRKRVISCIGALGSSCDTPLFSSIVTKVLEDLQSQDQIAVRTGVQAIWSISKTSGHRLGPHLKTIVPILLTYSTMEHETDNNDLKEQCLQALESFCLRCKTEMIEFMPSLIQCITRMAKYDPNYVTEDNDDFNDEADDDASDNNESEEEEEEEDDDMYDDMDDDYSDDDDSSWKVRRASIRCVNAIITSKLLKIDELCEKFGPFLALRFKEREETVKLDVFEAFIHLLQLARSLYEIGLISTSSSAGKPDESMTADNSIPNPSLEPIISKAPQIFRRIKTQMEAKSANVKIHCMSLIAEFIRAVPSLAPRLIAEVIKPILQSLLDTGTPMKMEAILCLRSMVEVKLGYPLKQYIERVIVNLLASAKSMYYKVTAECITLCGDIICVFGKAPEDVKSQVSTTIEAVHNEVLSRATAQDQDSEIKQASLKCLGEVMHYFATSLDPKRIEATQVALCDRLKNDVTRIATVRAMHTIALSPNVNVLVPVMDRCSSELCGFLRKSNVTIRMTTLELLSVAPLLSEKINSDLITNLSELLNENNLGASSLALLLLARLLRERGTQLVSTIGSADSAYTQALKLATSSLLQKKIMDALYEFFKSIATLDVEPLNSQKVIQDLKEKSTIIIHNPTASGERNSPLQCVAKCVVAVCEGSTTDICNQITLEIINNAMSTDLVTRNFSLVSLGQLGNQNLLRQETTEYKHAHEAILQSLNHDVENIRAAAAIAFGGVASSNNCSGIPELMSLLKEEPSKRYLFLLSLKETITCSELKDVVPYVSRLLPVLLESQSDSQNGVNNVVTNNGNKDARIPEEESIRSATAECLSLLFHVAPETVISSITQAASSPSTRVRASVAAAIRFTATSNNDTNNDTMVNLKSGMKTVTKLIGDDDVSVAKNAVQAVNAVARSFPSSLSADFKDALQEVYARTAKDKNLVRVVDLGPFKHEDDFGLDLRKSAFDCLRAFISGPLIDLISIPQLMEHIAPGLKDQGDVRSIAQLTLALVAKTSDARQIVHSMTPLLSALEFTLRERVKENAVRQETERHEDSVRGALRAIRMMEKVPEISTNCDFQKFMEAFVRTSRYMEMYAAISQNEEDLMTLGNRSRATTTENKTGIVHSLSKWTEDVVMVG